MKIILGIIGITSTLVTVLVNFIPDTGTKVILFTLFGLLIFGGSWALNNIKKLLNGVILGVIVGGFLGIIVATIDVSLKSLPKGITYDFVLSLKWILPILAYSYFGIAPWIEQQ
jgi:hypothetical protein